MRYLIRIAGTVIGLYFIARAVAEPFVIDLGDPSTYHNDWGGPHLAGVLAVHCGPGLIALVVLVVLVRRRLARPRTAPPVHRDPPRSARS